MNKEKLLRDKKETISELFYFIVGLLLFPLTGFGLLCLYIAQCISDLHNINKKIKEEKIKEIMKKDLLIIKDENGFIKDIKL